MNSPIHQGLAFHEAGKLREAEQVYRQILAREPNNADALHLLGVIATQVRQFESAAKLIESAIRVNPSIAFYHNNLGNALRGLDQIGEAEMCYRQAITLQPDYVDAQVNLGTTLREEARFDEAVEAYQRAAQLAPNMAEAHVCLGTVLKDQGRIDEAISSYKRAMELDSQHVVAHSNLLYAMHDSDRVTPAQMLDEHRRWGARHAEPLTRLARPHGNDRSPDRRLRVGYVSADFRDHPVARFLWPMIEHRDRTNFEIVCFSGVEKPDEVTARYRAAVDEWHDVATLSDDALADLVRSRGMDVLVDLAGHTSGTRLLAFARRPAPVQMTYLGYPDTTGISAIDVRIADALTDPPPAAQERCVERLERVDGCFLCYPLTDLPPVAPLPAMNAGHVTFGSFNSLAKISPATLRLWRRVLEANPQSRMIVKATRLGDEQTCVRAAERFRAAGMPMDRIELLGPQTTPREHLRMYDRIDIALDTFPYNGTTTTCEALSMGVPVVSLAGEHHAARVGLSLLSAAGFGAWAANESDRFVEIAKELASNPSRLAEIRAGLRDSLGKSALCDGRAFAPKIERIYRDAWQRWCRG